MASDIGDGLTAGKLDDTELRAYLSRVCDWHGYIRFVGLPHLRENPDVAIDQLFVEPAVSDRYISPDLPSEDWPITTSCLNVLASERRLVILGDPGSGKSTLVSRISSLLASGRVNAWSHELGPLVPLPMVLRDLAIPKPIDWDGLIGAFLDHQMCHPLRDSNCLPEILKAGRALIMLDGLDELGDVTTRAQLRAAVFQGMRLYPQCRWLLTSRIVGYEDVPFDRVVKGKHTAKSGVEEWREVMLSLVEDAQKLARRLGVGRMLWEEEVGDGEAAPGVTYIAPFNNVQLMQFAQSWFELRDAVSIAARQSAVEFVDRLYRDPATLRLARVPNVLTMMALIYRVRARLPHGRALLYNEIAQAYLESIDEYRGLREVDFPLAQKKRWLAKVGFEMQLRRSPVTHENAPREILADESDIVAWVLEAMESSGYGPDEEAAVEFLSYIGRRSGLLLPRGPGKFAFMHLSFQEYFAACFLAEQVTSPLGIIGKTEDDLEVKRLIASAWNPAWRETFVFLFELLADRAGWPEALARVLFGEEFRELQPTDGRSFQMAELIARLAIDPHSGFPRKLREEAIRICWKIELGVQRTVHAFFDEPKLARILFSAEADQLPMIGRLLADVGKTLGTKELSLVGCTAFSDLSAISSLRLEILLLSGTSVRNLTPLTPMTELRYLSLADSRVEELLALSTFPELTALSIAKTAVSNLSGLEGLRNLEYLDLRYTKVRDLTPLRGLSKLKVLRTEGANLLRSEEVEALKKDRPELEISGQTGFHWLGSKRPN